MHIFIDCPSFTHLLLHKWCAPVEFEWVRFCTLLLNIENLDTNQTKMGAIQQMIICRMQIQSFIEGSARLISFWEMMMYRLSRALLDKAFWAIWTTSTYLFPPFQQSTKEKNMARDTNTCSNNFVIHCPKAYFSQPVGIDVEKKLGVSLWLLFRSKLWCSDGEKVFNNDKGLIYTNTLSNHFATYCLIFLDLWALLDVEEKLGAGLWPLFRSNLTFGQNFGNNQL